MNVPSWVMNLLPEIQKSVIFGMFAFCVACAVYLRRRLIDKKWLREHGQILYVYFRNIEWRCVNLQKFSKDFQRDDLTKLKLELVKLRADLDALGKLLEMWSRRMKFIHLFFGYVRLFDDATDAFIELHISLIRHIDPLLEMIQLEIDASKDVSKTLPQDFPYYIGYFNGGSDRIWGAGLIGEYSGTLSQEQTDFNELKSKRLHGMRPANTP